jgi:hypothetical protein
MANPVDNAGNVRVDHVWGNMPIQPDDARGANTLDPALDNHVIVTTGRYGFPGYTVSLGDGDAVANAIVPNILGITASEADAALVESYLISGTVGTVETADGATAENDGTVATQATAAGTQVNQGDAVNYAVYDYVV